MKDELTTPLKFVWSTFKGHYAMFYIFIFGKVLQGIFYVVLPVLAKLEIDQLVEKNEQLFGIIHLSSFNIFLIILGVIFLVQLLETLIKGLLGLFEEDYVKIYDNFYSEALYKRLENISVGIFLNARNKRFINDILDNSSKIGNWVRRFIGNIISNIFLILGIITVIALINIWILVIIIISSICVFYIERYKRSYEKKNEFSEQYDQQSKIWILTMEIGRNFAQLYTAGGFYKILKLFSQSNDTIRKNAKALQKINIVLGLFSFIIENISGILIKVIIGWGVFVGTTSIGTMTLVLMYISRIQGLFNDLKNFTFLKNELIDDLLKLNLFLEITEQPKELGLIPQNVSSIEFKNVAFTYPNFAKYESKYLDIIESRIRSYNSKKYSKECADELEAILKTKAELANKNPEILSNVDMRFEAGKIYGIVGKNGAGKTTLISLMQNFFSNYSGNIFFGRDDIQTIDKSYFIENIAIITQSPYIVEGLSIRENLLMGVKKEYSDEYIYELLGCFGLRKQIEENKLGLDSDIGYNDDFSGGEKQIIALTRIILQDKPIIIMDEGTNQLDAENEAKAISKIFQNKENKIIIFITHRMTSIRKADVIYCLEEGKVQISGSHADLLKGKNIYKDFWHQQVES